MERNEILAAILRKQPKIHCLTNPVTMNDVANILLAAGGSAVMAQDEQEAAEITTFCQGTLLNTGVPDEAKIRACILAGKRANQLGHPVVLDPVGVGGSSFRRRELRKLLDHVHFPLIQSYIMKHASAMTHQAAIRKKRLYSVLFIRNRKHIFPTAAWKAACIWMRRT